MQIKSRVLVGETLTLLQERLDDERYKEFVRTFDGLKGSRAVLYAIALLSKPNSPLSLEGLAQIIEENGTP